MFKDAVIQYDRAECKLLDLAFEILLVSLAGGKTSDHNMLGNMKKWYWWTEDALSRQLIMKK